MVSSSSERSAPGTGTSSRSLRAAPPEWLPAHIRQQSGPHETAWRSADHQLLSRDVGASKSATTRSASRCSTPACSAVYPVVEHLGIRLNVFAKCEGATPAGESTRSAATPARTAALPAARTSSMDRVTPTLATTAPGLLLPGVSPTKIPDSRAAREPFAPAPPGRLGKTRHLRLPSARWPRVRATKLVGLSRLGAYRRRLPVEGSPRWRAGNTSRQGHAPGPGAAPTNAAGAKPPPAGNASLSASRSGSLGGSTIGIGVSSTRRERASDTSRRITSLYDSPPAFAAREETARQVGKITIGFTSMT